MNVVLFGATGMVGAGALHPSRVLRAPTTIAFGRALIEVAARGYHEYILHSRDINALPHAG